MPNHCSNRATWRCPYEAFCPWSIVEEVTAFYITMAISKLNYWEMWCKGWIIHSSKKIKDYFLL